MPVPNPIFQPEALEHARANLLQAQATGDSQTALNAWFEVHRLLKQKHQRETVTEH
jgi:hypothetical protein